MWEKNRIVREREIQERIKNCGKHREFLERTQRCGRYRDLWEKQNWGGEGNVGMGELWERSEYYERKEL